MSQYYVCIACSQENEIDLDLSDGDHQHHSCVCEACGKVNEIDAVYNYGTNEFELGVSAAEAG